MQIIYQLHINYDLSCAVNPKVMFEDKHLRLFSWSLMTQKSKKEQQRAAAEFHTTESHYFTNLVLINQFINHLSNVYPPPSTIYYLQSSIHRLPSTVYHQTSTIYCPSSAVNCSSSKVHCPPTTIYRLPSTVYHPQSTIHHLPSNINIINQ